MIQNLTLEQISSALLFLVALFGGLGYILRPLRDYKASQDKINKRLDDIELHEKKDLERFEKYDKDLQQVLLSVNVLLSHSIDNNHTQQLKERKAELDEYLIKR